MQNLIVPEMLLAFGNTALRVAVIIIVAFIVLKSMRVMADKAFLPDMGWGKKFQLEEKRARTLKSLFYSIIRYTIYFIAIVMILQEFRIDTTSLIAGAGILGLAVGVGAQSLIKDMITGFFILMEDQYAVGDYIVSGSMAGTVEEIGFRVTKLRDANGVLHIIPHGEISRISNYTRGHMQASVLIPVTFEANIDKVLEIIKQVCVTIGRDLPEVIEGPTILGITEFRPGEIVVRVVAKTVPLEQAKVEAALRYHIKLLFDQNNIPMPAVVMGRQP